MRYRLNNERTKAEEPGCWIAPSADLIGSVTIGSQSSVWWQAVLRADNEPITIGSRTNIQDGCVLHTDPGFPITVGSNVSVGHLCMLHGCKIGDGSLIGIGSIVLNGANIGKNVLVGANSLITEGKEIPDNSLVIGSPGRVTRNLSQEEADALIGNADNYVNRSERYREELKID